MLNRAMVAGIAENLLDDGQTARAEALIAAVRCCVYFPECAHIVDWVEALDTADCPQSTPTSSDSGGV